MLTKYALVAIIVLCCTVLGFTLMVSFTNGSIIRITSRQRRSILPGSALSICC
ncbi:hypothetical protein RBJ41_05565 [Escherichia coli]|nr:hypothetical protein [Escherichia coli]MDT0836819.1 hypothetical protein [Escherichia coli]